jgi:hypothetical protein
MTMFLRRFRCGNWKIKSQASTKAVDADPHVVRRGLVPSKIRRT